jgi:hypothetical protein
MAAASVSVAAVTIAAMTFARPAAVPLDVSRLVISYEGLQLTVRPGIAISPDGARVVYESTRRLHLREIGDSTSRTIAATGSSAATPVNPVFSPDGTAVAFYNNIDSEIRVVGLNGGSPIRVCETREMPAGLTWSGEFIYFANSAGIMRVRAAGGQPELVIRKDPADAMTRPQVLLDGRLLFSISKREAGKIDRWVNASIVVQRPGDEQPMIVVENGSDPRYLTSGHLVYVAAGVLYARRFDPLRLATGPPIPMVDAVFRSTGATGGGLWWYGVSDNGTLIYRPAVAAVLGTSQLAAAREERADLRIVLNWVEELRARVK